MKNKILASLFNFLETAIMGIKIGVLIGLVLLTIAFLSLFSSCCSIPLYEGKCFERAVKAREYLVAQGYEAEFQFGEIYGEPHAGLRYRKNNSEWKVYKNLYSK